MLMLIATLSALLNGTGIPLTFYIFGGIIDTFLEETKGSAILNAVTWSEYNTTKMDAIRNGLFKYAYKLYIYDIMILGTHFSCYVA